MGKMYNLTLDENKLVSAIVNDITNSYKAHAYTKSYEKWVNEGIKKVRERALTRGLLLDECDLELPAKDIKAIVREQYGKTA